MPETRYAKSGDVHIVYQVSGDGPLDVVLVPGFISNVELAWDMPFSGPALRKIGSFAVGHFLRQAGNRSLRSDGRNPDARTAHGRRTGRDGCRGDRLRFPVGDLGGWADVHALRCDLPDPHLGSRAAGFLCPPRPIS